MLVRDFQSNNLIDRQDESQKVNDAVQDRGDCNIIRGRPRGCDAVAPHSHEINPASYEVLYVDADAPGDTHARENFAPQLYGPSREQAPIQGQDGELDQGRAECISNDGYNKGLHHISNQYMQGDLPELKGTDLT